MIFSTSNQFLNETSDPLDPSHHKSFGLKLARASVLESKGVFKYAPRVMQHIQVYNLYRLSVTFINKMRKLGKHYEKQSLEHAIIIKELDIASRKQVSTMHKQQIKGSQLEPPFTSSFNPTHTNCTQTM